MIPNNSHLQTFVLIYTGKCSPYSSSRKCLSTTDGDYYRKPYQSKCTLVEPSPTAHIYKTFLHLSLGEHCRKLGRKRVRSEDQGTYCEMVSPTNVRSYTHKVFPTWLPNHDLSRDDTNGHAKVNRKVHKAPALPRGSWGKLGEEGLPREVHRKWLSSPKWSPFNIHVLLLSPRPAPSFFSLFILWSCLIVGPISW